MSFGSIENLFLNNFAWLEADQYYYISKKIFLMTFFHMNDETYKKSNWIRIWNEHFKKQTITHGREHLHLTLRVVVLIIICVWDTKNIAFQFHIVFLTIRNQTHHLRIITTLVESSNFWRLAAICLVQISTAAKIWLRITCNARESKKNVK